MPPNDEEAVCVAYGQAIAGDADQLIALLDPTLEWRGMTRGHLWWRRTPS